MSIIHFVLFVFFLIYLPCLFGWALGGKLWQKTLKKWEDIKNAKSR